MRNPYVTDRPLTAEDLFTGRERQLSRVLDLLNRGQRLIFLFGLPRSGKTSFVNQLPRLIDERYVVRRIEVEGLYDASSDEDPLWLLVLGVGKALGQALPNHATYAARGESYATDYLVNLVGSLEDRYLVCFDQIHSRDLEATGEWEWAMVVLRSALQRQEALRVLVVAEGLPAESDSDVMNETAQLILEPLSEDEGAMLLMAPVRGVLVYDADVLRQIHRYAGGNPFLMQLFGQLLFDMRAAAGWVSRSEAERALEEVLAQSAPAFEALWDASDDAEKLVLAALTEMWGHHGFASAKDVATYLGKLRIRMPLQDIQTAFAGLRQRGVVQELGGGTFRVTAQLYGRWIQNTTSTLQTLRDTRRYRRGRDTSMPPYPGKRVDWTALLLWVVAGSLVLLIAYVWRGRERLELLPEGQGRAEAASTPGPEGSAGIWVPTPEPGVISGRLVYQAREDANAPWDIWIMRADGTDPIRLTDSEWNDYAPVWSPDGRRIAFVSDRDGVREIYVMNADGNQQVNLTRNGTDDWTPAWSPDGRQIAFSSFRDGNWEIYSMDASGGNPRRITRHGAIDHSPAWSPDGRRLAFVSDRDGNLEIYMVDVDGSNLARLTNDPATDQGPAWSPDGERVLWESYRDGNMAIYAANTDGSDARAVSLAPGADSRGATWSLCGTRIAFYSNADDGWDIFSLHLESGMRTNLTQSPAHETRPHWGR